MYNSSCKRKQIWKKEKKEKTEYEERKNATINKLIVIWGAFTVLQMVTVGIFNLHYYTNGTNVYQW